MIEKIVSGGQTGADRAALDVAIELGLETGGWIPRGRRAEDDVIPDVYSDLTEANSTNYAERTRLNVLDSDATLVLAFGPPTGGTALTAHLAHELNRPYFVIDLEQTDELTAIADLRAWLTRSEPRVLNVAGPRLSKEPRIASATANVLRGALRAGPD